MVRGRRVILAGSWLGLGLAVSSCGAAEEKGAPPIATQTGSGADDDSADSGSSGGETNCGGMPCTGHGACVLMDDVPTCVCDGGYELVESGECVVDEDCIEISYLEDRCRQVFGGAPAVTLFFAVDFCAGTAVLPADLTRLGIEFVVYENGTDIEENVESYSTIIDKDVESYVSVAIDVSDSVEATGDLPALITELRTFVQSLAPAPGEPDVYVSLDVFGAEVAEYVPFTRDFDEVEAKLAAIESDFESVSTLVGGGVGTALYDAVELGLQRTDRVRKLRDAATWGGVLTTGTVVVVTDGIETTGADLPTSLIGGTTNQLISIGISDMVDDLVLGEIGPDGSFLAPTVDEWQTSFAEIAQRVDQYPERSYLLGYCSSLNEGDPNVEVRARFMDTGLESVSSAVCRFVPSYFGTAIEDVCSEAFFLDECDDYDCGGVTACGACSADACCTGHQCEAATTATELDITCNGQNSLCVGAGQICDAKLGTCVDPAGIGEPCGTGCNPGVGHCDVKTMECIATVALGEPCTAPEQCETLHCQNPNPDNPGSSNECLPAVGLYGPCGDDVAICEIGSYCSGSTCLPQLIDLETCSSGEMCRRGQCTDVEGSGSICLGDPACFWSWDQKYPD